MGNPPFSKNVKKIVVIMTIRIVSLVFYENRNFAISDDWAEKIGWPILPAGDPITR